MLPITMQRPETLGALWDLLAKHPQGYSFLAGGTDLVVQGHHGLRLDRVWIDLTRLGELAGVEDRGDCLWIGATATWSQLKKHPLVARRMPCMPTCCLAMGSPQIRSLGTLGGNVANASPAGDSIPVLLAYDTRVVLKSREATRTLPLEDFLLGVGRTDLQDGELIWGFEVPHAEEHASRFLKLGTRQSLSISKVNAAVKASRKNGVLHKVSIAIGSAAPTVFRAREAEKILEGQWPGDAKLELAAEAARERSSPITDARSTKEYRRAMVGVLVHRGLTQVMDELAG
jgi:CO/xanthine dehydrogenase FAD-binding subunit